MAKKEDELQRMNETVERLRQEYSDDPNVNSIGIGLRYRGGELQDEVCITFFVHRKYRSQRELEASGSRPIPKEVDGFPTDVDDIELLPQQATGERDEIIRDPLIGSVASSNAEQHIWLFNGFGTLGVLCRDSDGKAMALSNWHVWADGGDAGDDIIQPAHPRAVEHLEGFGKVLACGPLLTSLIEGDMPSPLTWGLYGGAAAAAIAAAASDHIDPIRRGQEATPTNPGERTQVETVDMAIEYPDLPWPGTPFRVNVKWDYTRQTEDRVLNHTVEESKRNPQFLLGRYLTVDKAQYEQGGTVSLTAAIWDYQPRPCDAYHAVAHLIPVADTNRVLRTVLHPVSCPRTVPHDPPKRQRPGQKICFDFGITQPGQTWPPTFQFTWLSVTNLAKLELRSVDWHPDPSDGRGELYIPREGLLLGHPPATRAIAHIVHFNQPVQLTAYDAAGNVVGSATSPADQGMVHELTVEAPMIVRTQVHGGGGEAVLLDYCIVPVAEAEVEVEASEEMVALLESERVLTHLPNPRRWQARRCCFEGEIVLPPTEMPGAWNAYLTVQNINHVPYGTDPVVAATVIGGHVLTPSAEVLGCAAIMLADHSFDVI